jgi:hypothetical protein
MLLIFVPLGSAVNNRGNAYREKKDYDKAISDFNEAIFPSKMGGSS